MNFKKLIFLANLLFCINLFCQSDFVYNVETVSQIIGSTLNFNAKDIIRTQGYHQSNDGGSAIYIVEADSDSSDDRLETIRINSNYTVVLDKNQSFNVKMFGAKDDVNFDSTTYLQNAIDFCIDYRISDLYVPEGIFRISQPLIIRNKSNGFATANDRPAGINIISRGPNHTIFRSLASLTGPMIKIVGLAFDSNAYVESTYINGGGINGIEFQGGLQGNENNHGIEILAWWNAEIKNCKFSGFYGDGIRIISDVSVDPNPDYSASLNNKFENLIIERNIGYGFNDYGSLSVSTPQKIIGQGSPQSIFEHCVFILNQKGGVYIQSSSVRFKTCSIASNGWYKEDIPNNDVAYGLHYGGLSSTFNGRHIVEGCEFDNNKTAHILIETMSNSRFSENRFINDDRDTDQINPSLVSILFNPDGPNDSVRNVIFKNNFFRTDNNGDFPNLTLFDFINTQDISNIYIENNSYNDNTIETVTSPKVILTSYNNFDINNIHLKNNFVFKDNNFEFGKTVTSYGTPAPFYLGTIDSNNPLTQGVTGNEVMHLLKFNKPNDIFNDIPNSHYNTSTGIFTCPEKGFYKIDVQLAIKDLLVNQRARLHLRRVNDVNVILADYVWGTSNSRINVDMSSKFYANKGDQMYLEIGVSGPGQLKIEPIQYGFNILNIEFIK